MPAEDRSCLLLLLMGVYSQRGFTDFVQGMSKNRLKATLAACGGHAPFETKTWSKLDESISTSLLTTYAQECTLYVLYVHLKLARTVDCSERNWRPNTENPKPLL